MMEITTLGNGRYKGELGFFSGKKSTGDVHLFLKPGISFAIYSSSKEGHEIDSFKIYRS